MKRRKFITLLGGAAAWPLTARAQQSAMPVVGVLGGGSAEAFAPLASAFHKGLSESGLVEGKNVAFDARWANGQFDRLPGLAADLVARRPAVIATQTLPGALAAKGATDAIPIVFVIGENPVEVGLVASFNRPGGNVTGMTNFMNVLGAKRLELASETAPKAAVLALLVNPNNPNAEADTGELKMAADALGRRLHVLTARTDDEMSKRLRRCGRTERRCAVHQYRSFLLRPARTDCCTGGSTCRSHDLPAARVRCGRRTDELRRELCRSLAPSRALCRDDSQGH